MRLLIMSRWNCEDSINTHDIVYICMVTENILTLQKGLEKPEWRKEVSKVQKTPDKQERGRTGSIIIFASYCLVFICLHLRSFLSC